MGKVIITDTNLVNIANAIRAKNGTQNTYYPSQMANAITNLPSGGNVQANKTVTPVSEGLTVTPDAGYDSLAQVTVSGDVNLVSSNIRKGASIFNVNGTAETGDTSRLQAKTVNPSSSQQVVTPDTGYTGLSQVTVGAVSSSTLTVSANGTYEASGGTFYSTVVVDIEDSKVNLQAKTITPSNTAISVVPDSGYQGLSSVAVNPIPSNYADISDVTATSSDVLTGKVFIDSTGTPKTGLLIANNYYVGSTDPDASIGSNGDLYFKV